MCTACVATKRHDRNCALAFVRVTRLSFSLSRLTCAASGFSGVKLVHVRFDDKTSRQFSSRGSSFHCIFHSFSWAEAWGQGASKWRLALGSCLLFTRSPHHGHRRANSTSCERKNHFLSAQSLHNHSGRQAAHVGVLLPPLIDHQLRQISHVNIVGLPLESFREGGREGEEGGGIGGSKATSSLPPSTSDCSVDRLRLQSTAGRSLRMWDLHCHPVQGGGIADHTSHSP